MRLLVANDNPFSEAFETDADLTLWGLNMEQSMPDAVITVFIHLE